MVPTAAAGTVIGLHFSSRQSDLDKLGLTLPRIEEYLQPLKPCGSLASIAVGVSNGDVAFTVYSFGNVADSYTKRIVYSQNTPSPLRDDTDTPSSNVITQSFTRRSGTVGTSRRYSREGTTKR